MNEGASMDLTTLQRLGGIIGGALLLVMLMVASYWTTITRHIIRADLRYYGQQVRASSLPISEKTKLLDRIEGISDRIEGGAKLGLIRWQESDETVRELLAHRLTADEVALIDRELERAERRLVD